LAHSEETAPRPRKEISRRGLFRRAGELSKSGAETLLKNAPLLSTEELELEGVSFRKLLHRQMKESEGTFRWEIPALREGCTGCGVCVKSCPTRALSLREEGKMLVLESWKCVGCKSCAIACPQRKINGMERVRIRDFSPLCLTHYQSIVCRQCGAHMKAKTHNGLCGECTRKRMRSAAQRRSRKEESV
jgi:Fe-S-cluster-containing dehydrogenase component